jgi:uncharacterized protein YlzI (FlbEa/FlbD family)
MSSNNFPENLVGMNHAHCQLLTEQVKALETRVLEMERQLVAQASRMHDALTERLDSLFDNETIIEFEPFPGSDGTIKVTNHGQKQIATGKAGEVFETIKAARDQLACLNETIQSIQLAR